MSADFNGCIVVFSVHSGVQIVIDGGKDYVMSNQRAVSNLNPALVLEVTAGVDEHIPPNGDIFPEVRIERGEQPEVGGNLLPGQPPAPRPLAHPPGRPGSHPLPSCPSPPSTVKIGPAICFRLRHKTAGPAGRESARWDGRGNFDRPAWKRLIVDIEAGKVEHLLVKDLSRVGRDYLQTGFYTEVVFKRYGIHFVAIGNSIDSNDPSSGEFAPFVNLV